MSWTDKIRAWGFPDGGKRRASGPCSPAHERLARAFFRLQEIQRARSQSRDPRFESAAEERIVWRELLELELQEIDEQIERILAAGGKG